MTPVNGQSRVPPGFRFHPTDEELINYYLRKKVASEKFELDVIREVDLNKLEPWDLHDRCKIDSTQTDWYFFSHKDKKYPTGTRTNRATAAGFWKATGRDKAVHSNFSLIGMRKTLVFYRGRAPHGQKTDWIMHEYRLEESESGTRGNEDGWVVCRVFKKRSHQQKGYENHGTSSEEEQAGLQNFDICRHPSRNSVPGKSFTCKQEIGVGDYGIPHFPFLQLPHLESPKINCSAPWSNPASDIRRIFTDSCKRADLTSPFALELAGVEGSKTLFVPEDNLADYADSAQLTEWGMLESMSKEMRYNADISNFSGDIQYSVHNRQQPTDYPTSCEVELWNFAR